MECEHCKATMEKLAPRTHYFVRPVGRAHGMMIVGDGDAWHCIACGRCKGDAEWHEMNRAQRRAQKARM